MKRKPLNRMDCREAIDAALARQSKDFEELLTMLQRGGWEVKRGKRISLKGKGQERFKRLDSLGEDYSEAALLSDNRRRERASSKRKENSSTDAAGQSVGRYSGKAASWKRRRGMSVGRRSLTSNKWRRRSIICLRII